MDFDTKQPEDMETSTPSSDSASSTFKTPEEIAAEDGKKSIVKPLLTAKVVKTKGLPIWRNLTKKRKIIVLCIAGIIIVGGGAAVAYLLIHHNKKPLPKPVITHHAAIVPPKPTTVPSALTGLLVAPAINQQPITGIMIENSDAARPQSGFLQAGVVFEAVAEGGVTRFLTLFQNLQPTASIGPVRSVRPYYLGWDLGFDAPIAHVGGSPDALADISTWGAKNLDEFYNASAYTRITSRQAPHNVYTTMADLNALEVSKGFTTSKFSSFPRKADTPLKQPTAKSINFSLSSSDYNPHFDYIAATNSYNRSEGGAPFTDQQTGAQISPKTVLAIVVPLTQGALDATGAYYSEYSYLGSGQVDVFQDGSLTIGTWQKTANTSQITFTGANGKPIPLNAGQTWITAVGSAGAITYSP